MSLEITKFLQANAVGGNTAQGTANPSQNKQDSQSIFAQPTNDKAAQVKEKTDKRNADVEAHENAHQQVAGAYANGKTIEWGIDELGNPLAVNGHVNVKTPQFIAAQASPEQIEQTIQQATTVGAAAIAPLSLGGEASKLSSADETVFAQSMAVLTAANSAKSQKSPGLGEQEKKPLNLVA